MGGGIALTALGVTAMPVGILFSMIHSEPACVWDFRDPQGCKTGMDGLQIFGISTIVGASAFIVGGVTMIIFGARRVPVSIASGPNGTPGATLQLTF